MTVFEPLQRFSEDQRAVSAVIGFILIFAILMLMLTMYQAQIVPQQNAQTEFKHFEEVQNELIELRNGVSTAGQADTPQFPSVTLGTTYRTRTLTINPPSPTGTLETSDPYNITITNQDGNQTTVSTRLLKYDPGYFELSVGTIWFENGVLYLDEREQSGFNVIEEQTLLRGNETLRVNALQNEFSETGEDRVTIELYPTEDTNADEIPEGNLSVSLPTRLNESDYWGDAFEEDPNEIFDEVNESAIPKDDDVYALKLNVSDDDLRLNTVGVRSTPDEGATRQNVQSPGGGESGGNADVSELSVTVNINERGPPNSGGNRIILATFEHSPTPSNNIEFSIRQGGSVIASESSENSPTEVEVDGSPQDLPVDLRANIENGGCYEIQVSDDTEDGDEFNLLEQRNSCD